MSGWLSSNVRAEDEVVMWVDVGGREHELLSRMLLEDSLLLVDMLHVKWHLQHLVHSPFRSPIQMHPHPQTPQNWEWPLMWEGIFSLLQLNFTAEVAPLPRMVVPGGDEAAEGQAGEAST